jgi:hypothetical protein
VAGDAGAGGGGGAPADQVQPSTSYAATATAAGESPQQPAQQQQDQEAEEFTPRPGEAPYVDKMPDFWSLDNPLVAVSAALGGLVLLSALLHGSS